MLYDEPLMPEPKKVTSSLGPKTYPGMPEFSEWHPWGSPPDHTVLNENYIPVHGANQQQFNYPEALHRMMDHVWKAGTVNRNAPRGPVMMGASPQRLVGYATNVANDFARVQQRAQLEETRRRAFGPKAGEWHQMRDLQLVAAYTFRGDTRTAEQIRGADGFQPPSKRTDDYYQNVIAEKFARYYLKMMDEQRTADAVRTTQEKIQQYLRSGADKHQIEMLAEYHAWRGMFRREEMHIGEMSESPFLKGYVSTTRDMKIAIQGSTGALATDMLDIVAPSGWIYAVRVEPGFLLRPKVAGVKKEEAEIAHLGPVPWKQVYGFRCFTTDPALKDRIYVRYGFDATDNAAFRQVLGSLSIGLKGEILEY
jgi:hypothetical protein